MSKIGWIPVLLVLLALWYGLATLPFLDRMPVFNWDEGEIAAVSHKMASQGVFGSDLYYGYYRNESRNYYFMPLFPLFQAGAFKIGGLGVPQARWVGVLCGLVLMFLTFYLGKHIDGASTGLLAAAMLCLLSVSLWPHSSGMPLLDTARTARYDILAAMWVTAACLCFLHAAQRGSFWLFFTTGTLAGIATLSHLYGAFVLAVFGVVLLWREGPRLFQKSKLYAMAGGWVVMLLPWLVYILLDDTAYTGQMRKWHAMERLDWYSPSFIVENVVGEYQRYLAFFAGKDGFHLFPRAGIWILVAGVPTAMVLSVRRIRAQHRLEDRFLLLVAPMLALLLAAITKFKLTGYTILVMPFLVLLTARAGMAWWRWCGKRRAWRVVAILVGLAFLAEGAAATVQYLTRAAQIRPYAQIMQPFRDRIPENAVILAANTYWLGLAPRQTRSVYLPFFLSHPAYHEQPLPMSQTLRALAPDFLLVDAVVSPEFRVPPGTADALPAFQHFWVTHCGQEVLSLSDPDYGPLTLYRCQEMQE